ncbi:anaerobic glycerol-3-phosphate dehydrogenase subunit A [Phaeovibrio sulfidiphilus]|uniref:Glycerol-3-phosphate dehydrogenase n=1 Tax=Phaeovibrio sulfidiphilus TaxID=1220600 RepID=A0A8J7CQT6_9PROT|nr:anaerobic glycerol-3-phosphate dehydrogenase subunit A [Phaeovibrio sulfidiphilus]MBE1237200.1 anaerobic glycerol-3-phosphate dehydrogenase subunit A [Phaeovibrio sulfidiphilus]
MQASPSSGDADVIIIGGGITGAGIARDCARRGLRALLVERRDYSTGATGRNHGLLHSGARYAVTDPESARECIEENRILRTIARHCVEDTGGLFISLPEDDLAFQKTFLDACSKADIPARALDPAEARRLEPSVNPELTGAVHVPDGAVDPFRLTLANILDATAHGARCLTYHEVTGLLKEGPAVTGVRVRNTLTGETREFRAPLTINAAGIWGQAIARMADVEVRMFPTRGALLILGHRLNTVVINRCRKPADADILVPGDTVSLIGTTSTPVPFEQVDDLRVTTEEVDLLVREGRLLAPALADTRMLRAYAGARPLIADEDDATGRSISRRIVLLDHESRDGCPGFITISGGKLITYRLMAEMTTDLVCTKLGVSARCDTATVPLPGSRETTAETLKKLAALPVTQRRSVVGRYGDEAQDLADGGPGSRSLVCECESVSVGEVVRAIETLGVHSLTDLRRRTRLGMGTCQGELCACRAAGLLVQEGVTPPAGMPDTLARLLEERWKGIRPVAWADALRESEFTLWLYQGVCGLGRPSGPNPGPGPGPGPITAGSPPDASGAMPLAPAPNGVTSHATPGTSAHAPNGASAPSPDGASAPTPDGGTTHARTPNPEPSPDGKAGGHAL